jgi:hypothetical protein
MTTSPNFGICDTTQITIHSLPDILSNNLLLLIDTFVHVLIHLEIDVLDQSDIELMFLARIIRHFNLKDFVTKTYFF